MAFNQIQDYIRKALIKNRSIYDITVDLISVGFSLNEVEDQLFKMGLIKDKTKPKVQLAFANLILLFMVLFLGGLSFYLWSDRIDLTKTNTEKVRNFYANLTQAQIAFSDTGEIVFPDQQKFFDKKQEYLNEQKSFIEANLEKMEIKLYEDGLVKDTFKILSKGKEGSWWETPTGNYKVLSKVVNGYSTIGNVWMPYSVQFYGNYLIHGWPHYDNGIPVPQGYSGGCIRLSDESAKMIFNFAQTDMPILVWEGYKQEKNAKLIPNATNAKLPSISAKSFLIIDLASDKTILEKNANQKLPVASLTKLMTAVVAHEVIYLGRTIKHRPENMANVLQVFSPKAGTDYIGLDLMYPLLMQSSNDSANLLASFIGFDNFMLNMNLKAESLSMTETGFADPSGISANNISTAFDLAKLLKYIYYKRPFLFDISRGKVFENVGSIKIGETISVSKLKNFNEFVDQSDLVGVKNGLTTAARETLATVWNITNSEDSVPVAIIVLGSEDRKKDTEVLLKWLKDNYVVSN